MLTLAFAQIVWSVVFQWDALTGGSNGLVGIWPSPWLAPKPAYYLLMLACTVAGGGLLVRMLHAPFGLALRAQPRLADPRRGDRPRACRACSGSAFVVAGTVAGLAGSLFAFAKGTISPETLGVGKSVDGLVMVLLGGVQSVSGPWVGAALFTWLQDTVARQTDYWRALLGIVMLALVLVFPLGVAGGLKRLFIREAAPRERGEVTRASAPRSRGLRKAFGGVRAVDDVSFDARRRRDAGADRPERRRQDDLLQHGRRPARARRRLGDARRPRARRPARPRRSGASASAAPSRSPRPSPR